MAVSFHETKAGVVDEAMKSGCVSFVGRKTHAALSQGACLEDEESRCIAGEARKGDCSSVLREREVVRASSVLLVQAREGGVSCLYPQEKS